MEISIMTENHELAEIIASKRGSEHISVDSINLNHGVIDSWYEILVTIGLITAPAGVTINVLSSFIYDSIVEKRKSQKNDNNSELKIKVEHTNLEKMKSVDIEIKLTNSDSVDVDSITQKVKEFLWEIEQL